MRQDGRMASQLDCSYDGLNEKPSTQRAACAQESRAGEDGRGRRSGEQRGQSPPAAGAGNDSSSGINSSGTPNGYGKDATGVAAARLKGSGQTSPTAAFAPPSTPAPHYSFRRNTANIMAAARRVSHRSSSVPSISLGDRGGDEASPSPSSAANIHDGVASTAAGRVGAWSSFYEESVRNASGASRRADDAAARGTSSPSSSSFAPPGTLPSRPGSLHYHSGLASAAAAAVAATAMGDNRNGALRGLGTEERTLRPDGDATAATGSPADRSRALTDAERRTAYRYSSGVGRAGSSPATPSHESRSNPSRQKYQLQSPPTLRHSPTRPHSYTLENGYTQSPELGFRDEVNGGVENVSEDRAGARLGAAPSSAASSFPALAGASPLQRPTSAWFAGLNTAQQERFEELQERSAAGHELARWRMLELMRHWMGMASTRSSLEAVIRDILADAGIAKTREAWGGGDSRSPAARRRSAAARAQSLAAEAAGTAAAATATTSASPPSTEAPTAKVSPKNRLVTSVASDTTAAVPGLPSPAAENDQQKKERRRRGSSPLSDDALAPSSSTSTHQLATTTVLASPDAGETLLPAVDGVSPVAEAKLRPTSSRRRRRRRERTLVSLPGDAPSPPSECLSPSHGDLDAGADAAVALPAALQALQTPEKQVAPTPSRTTEESPGVVASSLRTDLVKDAKATPPRSSAASSMQLSPQDTGLPASSRTSGSALRRSRSSRSSFKAAPAPREATYEEIPRFYFPLGRPTTREVLITGPISSKHENPHLKVADGVAMTAARYDGGEGGGLGANAEALVNSGDDSALMSEARRAAKVAPMSQLHALDDRQVAHHIQREFGRLPPFPRHSQRVRLLGGRLRSGGNSHGNLPFAKQELLYKQQFIQCVQRLCSQCFGVPRYFAFLIMRLIQWEVNNSNTDAAGEDGRPPTRTAGSRLGSSSSLLSHTTNGSSGSGGAGHGLLSVFLINAQHVKEFYDAYLKGKDTARRIFDLLILSSRLPSSAAAAASLAATSAVADANEPFVPVPGVVLGAMPLRSHLLPQDFVAYTDVLLTYHPGLAFLRQTPDFQTKYLDTVIYRIFYELDRYDRGSIRYCELASSRLVDAFRQVDSAEDINSVLLFFSYEHFYVLYCRFWELDEDRDMLLAPEDLMRYAPEDVMNPRIVQRVFAGVGRRRRCTVSQRIGYEDFVWFCLSEEDKSTPQAIRYWFRVLDLDGDGVLSVYELREFYDATRDKIAQYVQEGLVTFEDVACQVFDMMRCPEYRGLYLSDLLREPEAAAVALNLLTNVVKFLQFEQRDPFVAHQERLLGGPEQSTWDRFARLEYDRMALEADGEG